LFVDTKTLSLRSLPLPIIAIPTTEEFQFGFVDLIVGLIIADCASGVIELLVFVSKHVIFRSDSSFTGR
jgi:hypothetical protein